MRQGQRGGVKRLPEMMQQGERNYASFPHSCLFALSVPFQGINLLMGRKKRDRWQARETNLAS